VAAACRVAESGAKTVVLDEGAPPGGQIHRHRPNREPPEAARPWLDRLARSRAIVRSATSVFDAVRRAAGWRLCAEGPGGTCRIDAGALVLATGARELFLPFPGWTLPGVMGAGGAQALWKSGGSIRGRTAVVAGSGPLLLAVGASLARAGANVAVVAEQALRGSLLRFAGGLVRFPGKLVEAARYRAGFFAAAYRAGTWVAEARGGGRLESVALTDGVDRFEIRCDIAAIGYGLVPNTELPRLLGCEIRGGTVVVDSRQQTSVPGVFCAGEPCGVAGLDVAVAEGELAGLAAAGHAAPSAEARRLSATRSRGRRLAVVMDATFRPREELRSLARADTIVCRCEDVRLAALAPFAGIREAKLSTRAGMGPCQGRVCGPALAFLFGWDSDTVRPPIKPVALGSLLQEDSA
jgi:NADPH-dependent 2,4-dienoyl-CoA reductase/sulfur reductase-like enzyme